MLSAATVAVEAARVGRSGLFRAFVAIVLPISKDSLSPPAVHLSLSWSDFLFALS